MKYSVSESRQLMAQLVNEALDVWKVLYVDPSSDEYIDPDKTQEAVKYIMKKIILEMSDITRDILSVGYKIDTTEELLAAIRDNAKIAVLGYTSRKNVPVQVPTYDFDSLKQI